MPPTHHLHTDTRYDPVEGTWSVFITLNGSPCGYLGPVLDEKTADWLAEGVADGLSRAMQRAIAVRR